VAKLAPYLKAVIAAAVAGLSVLITSLDQGALSAQDYLSALVAFLVALGAVWAIPNNTPAA